MTQLLNRTNLPNYPSAPSSPANGDIYYNTSDHAVYARANGAWVDLGATGGGGATWNSYTPTFGGDFSAGDGTVTAKYLVSGKVHFVYARIVAGSTTSFGSALTMSLPGTPVSQVATSAQAVRFVKEFPVYGILSTATTVSFHIDKGSTAAQTYGEVNNEVSSYNDLAKLKTYTFLISQTRTLPLTSTRPFTWNTDDVFEANLWYEVA